MCLQGRGRRGCGLNCRPWPIQSLSSCHKYSASRPSWQWGTPNSRGGVGDEEELAPGAGAAGGAAAAGHVGADHPVGARQLACEGGMGSYLQVPSRDAAAAGLREVAAAGVSQRRPAVPALLNHTASALRPH